MTIRIEVEFYQAAQFGEEAYWSPRLTATFAGLDIAPLAAAAMVRALDSMFEGDTIRIGAYLHDTLEDQFTDRVRRIDTVPGSAERVDKRIWEMAHHIEHWRA